MTGAEPSAAMAPPPRQGGDPPAQLQAATKASFAGVPLGRWIAVIVLIATVAAAIPPFLVKVPPLLDLPNHLARLWLVAGGAAIPPLSSMYRVDWSNASTNIGVDLIARAFGGVLGIQLLGRLLLASALVLPPLGAIALNRRLFGGAHWWQAAFPLLAFCLTALAGFLNYQIGLGFALLAASLDPWLSRRPVWILFPARFAFASVILLFHPFSLLFYAVLLAGLAVGPDWNAVRSRSAFLRAMGRGLVAAASAAAPLILYALLARNTPGETAFTGSALAWGKLTLSGRLSVLLSPIFSYHPALDSPVLFAVLFPPAFALLRRRLESHAGLVIATAGLAALSMAMPNKIADTYWMDRRLPIMAFLAFVAALRPQTALSSKDMAAAAAALAGLVLARTAGIAWVWIARQSDVRAIERALSHVPAGAAVLPVEHTVSDKVIHHAPIGRYVAFNASYWHYPTLAIPWRHAFVPTLFTAAGKQPVRVLEPWKQIAVPEGPIGSVHWLIPGLPTPWPIAYARYWRTRFDYILVMNADLPDLNGPEPRLPGTTLVDDEGFARLFKVEKAQPAR